eukprot:gene289-biopygen203
MSGDSKSKKDLEDFPPLPGKPSNEQASPPPTTQDLLMQQVLVLQKQQGAILEMQRQQTEEHRLLRDELQRQSEINVALEAKIAAKSGSLDSDGAAKSAEQLLERRKKLAYVPEASGNPFPPRPATLTSRMPQLYDLHGSKTYDALSKKSNSSMRYECLVLAPALSYLHDVVCECNDTLDVADDGDLSYESLQNRFHAVSNSVHGVYAMLCNRWTMLELRGQLEQEPGSSQRGGADALRAKLQFVEDRVYQAADGLVADEVLQQWLNDFDKNRGKAVLSTTAKNAANADSRGSKEDRDRRWREWKKHDEDKDGKKTNGKGAEDRREIKKLRDGSAREGFLWREKVQQVLHRLGLRRNEKKGQWDPVQVVEHLGLEVDLRLGQFRVTERRVHKIHVKAKEILCDAARNRRWIPARRLAAFTGLCQSVYLAVPAARLYLRELYFVLAEKSSWGAKMRNWHITHLELEAVYKTVQAFLNELESKVVRLYCDNQAVVAMLSHFTSRNPDLMRRMRRLWSLLDLHDIELQARYIRSEANVWADNLSRCEDLDDWRLNREWFEWANKQWGPFTVDRFASEISTQLPRYYAAWKDPRCEGVDSLAYDWRGEKNWVNPPWALLDEVAHKLQEEGAAATVVAPYWPGQSWFWELEAIATEIINDSGVSELTNEAEDRNNENVKIGGDIKKNKRGSAVKNFLAQSLCERWKSELGQSRLSKLAVEMQKKALLDSTLGNYGPKAERFIQFCVNSQMQWLPATEATVLLYIASILDDGGVKATSLQPYLSAINNYHEDLRFPGPAKGRAVTRAVKGMETIQTELAMLDEENIETQRTWLPARHTGHGYFVVETARTLWRQRVLGGSLERKRETTSPGEETFVHSLAWDRQAEGAGVALARAA